MFSNDEGGLPLGNSCEKLQSTHIAVCNPQLVRLNGRQNLLKHFNALGHAHLHKERSQRLVVTAEQVPPGIYPVTGQQTPSGVRPIDAL